MSLRLSDNNNNKKKKKKKKKRKGKAHPRTGQFTLEQATKVQKGSRGITLLFL